MWCILKACHKNSFDSTQACDCVTDQNSIDLHNQLAQDNIDLILISKVQTYVLIKRLQCKFVNVAKICALNWWKSMYWKSCHLVSELRWIVRTVKLNVEFSAVWRQLHVKCWSG